MAGMAIRKWLVKSTVCMNGLTAYSLSDIFESWDLTARISMLCLSPSNRLVIIVERIGFQ